MLDSTIWFDKDARDIFITALLMAQPHEIREPAPQLEVNSLKETGFIVPVGWYGFVPASGPGIVTRAGMDMERGMAAIVRCGGPEDHTRTSDHDGRRMVRIDGGYIILNYDRYRQKDYTTAERSARYRARKQAEGKSKPTKPKPSRVTTRGVTQAEAYSEARHGAKPTRPKHSQMFPPPDHPLAQQ